MPWYRQYFWLLLFGGIILFTAIISFVMICVCKSQLSKSVTFRIQKSFKKKKRNQSTVIKNNSLYNSSGPSQIKLPNQMEKDFGISETSISVLPPRIYAMIQKPPRVPPRVPPQGLYPEYYAKKENTILDIHNPNDRNSSASYDSVGSISQVFYYNAAKDFEYYAKKIDTHLDIPNPNDRYSYASYDSVGSIAEMNYANANAAAAAKDREYVEVIPDDDANYDDVEISTPGTRYHWNNTAKNHRLFNAPDNSHQ